MTQNQKHCFNMEEYISLEAINCFEEWMKQFDPKQDFDCAEAGAVLREFATNYEVEDDNEIIYLLNKYFTEEDEYISMYKRSCIVKSFLE